METFIRPRMTEAECSLLQDGITKAIDGQALTNPEIRVLTDFRDKLISLTAHRNLREQLKRLKTSDPSVE